MTSLDHVTFVYLLDPAAAEAPDLPAAALSQQQHIKIPSNQTNPTYYALLLLIGENSFSFSLTCLMRPRFVWLEEAGGVAAPR